MKEGDKIIWDSGFGYDLGYYVRVDDNQYNNVLCNMVTGIVQRENSYSKQEVILFNEANEQMIREKYPIFAVIRNNKFPE